MMEIFAAVFKKTAILNKKKKSWFLAVGQLKVLGGKSPIHKLILYLI